VIKPHSPPAEVEGAPWRSEAVRQVNARQLEIAARSQYSFHHQKRRPS